MKVKNDHRSKLSNLSNDIDSHWCSITIETKHDSVREIYIDLNLLFEKFIHSLVTVKDEIACPPTKL